MGDGFSFIPKNVKYIYTTYFFLYVSITFKRFAKLSLIFNTSNYDVNTNNCSTSRLEF